MRTSDLIDLMLVAAQWVLLGWLLWSVTHG